MTANTKADMMSLPNELLFDIMDWLTVIDASGEKTPDQLKRPRRNKKVKGGKSNRALAADQTRRSNGLSVLYLSQVNRRLYHLALPYFLGKSTWRFVTQRYSSPKMRLHLMNGETVLPTAIELGKPPPLDGPRSYLNFVRRLEMTPYDLDVLTEYLLWDIVHNDTDHSKLSLGSLATMTGILGVCTHLTIVCPGVLSPGVMTSPWDEEAPAFGQPVFTSFRSWFAAFGPGHGQRWMIHTLYTRPEARMDDMITAISDLMPALRKVELRRVEPLPSKSQLDESIWVKRTAEYYYSSRVDKPSKLSVRMEPARETQEGPSYVKLGELAGVLEKHDATFLRKMRLKVKEQREAEDHAERVESESCFCN